MSTRSFPEGGVYCAGNIVVDILVRPVETLPPWGSSLWVESVSQHLGGNGALTAYTLAKLGTPARLCGLVGEDALGRYALEKLKLVGVDVSEVLLEPGSQTATTVGLINQRAERLFLHLRGASRSLRPEQIQLDACRVRGISYFHLGSFFHMPAIREGGAALLERARAAGLVTSVDTMWDGAGRWMADFGALCPWVDLLFVNQDEARMMAGSSELSQVGEFFRSRGAGIVILKMAGEGCAIAAAGEQFMVPAYDVTAVDTTGAGDCFCGGFLAALRLGFSLREAARFANAVAALSIQQIGGAEGLANLEETLAWMARAPVRKGKTCCITPHHLQL
jgi:sugar/nucleoside kinase (ribokinase family)